MCGSKHADSFPSKYSKLLTHEGPTSYPKLASLLAKESLFQKAMVSTTTAVDVIFGGVKVNALPELVTAQVNFRIDFSESVGSTQKHVAGILAKVAKKNGLHFRGFGKGDKEEELVGRFVKVDLLGLPLEPAPRTPAEGGVWEMFAGTVK
jgi:Gly-Xaa carboxypeptidase